MSGSAMSVTEPVIVTISMPTIVFVNAIHL